MRERGRRSNHELTLDVAASDVVEVNSGTDRMTKLRGINGRQQKVLMNDNEKVEYIKKVDHMNSLYKR